MLLTEKLCTTNNLNNLTKCLLHKILSISSSKWKYIQTRWCLVFLWLLSVYMFEVWLDVVVSLFIGQLQCLHIVMVSIQAFSLIKPCNRTDDCFGSNMSRELTISFTANSVRVEMSTFFQSNSTFQLLTISQHLHWQHLHYFFD